MLAKRLSVCLLAVLAAACGKRGDPTPPIPAIPAAVTDLAATQQGTTIFLSWTYPSLTTAGRALEKVQRVFIYRFIEDLPATVQGRDPRAIATVAAGTPDEVALFSLVPAPVPRQFLKVKETIATLTAEDLKGATSGGKLQYEDDPRIRTEDGRPVRVSYAVVTEGEARSDLSNLAVIVPLDVPTPPQNLSAAVEPDAVTLKWDAPRGTVTGATEVKLIGYNIYRFPAEGAAEGPPVNSAPVESTTYRDTPPYGVYRYDVTAVRAVGPPLLQSEPNSVVPVQYKDRIAPPVPTGLAALTEENAVRLVWDPVEAADLAGYKVYRTNGGTFLLTPNGITETTFFDTGLVPNLPYSYQVTSIDQLGNESAPARVAGVVVRK